jgi:1-piperideine-2-carboxylate/1-pyrroline-2-carboxylate reductase [NAD(P)H]
MSPQETAEALPYLRLASHVEGLLRDRLVVVPPRLVQSLPGGGSLFVMPAHDASIAITKLITFTPSNVGTPHPTIQGDIVVFDIATGRRILLLDGPTVTARRTAAVSLLAAQKLLALRRQASTPGPMLIVGAGVQGRSHLEAFRVGLGIEEVWVNSGSLASAEILVQYAKSLGMRAQRVDDANAALTFCPYVVSTTPAQKVVLSALPRDDAFVAAVGAFTPRMVEWSATICQHMAQYGHIFVDTRDADHEAGDLLQAGIDVGQFRTLGEIVLQPQSSQHRAIEGPIFFKSCGWAGWDLAAARCVKNDQAA